MCHTSAYVVLLLGLKRMNNRSLMSQCLLQGAFNCSIVKVVVSLIQSQEYLPSATNDDKVSNSFHILGNPSFTSSTEWVFWGEFGQSGIHQDQFPPGFGSLPARLVWLSLFMQLRVIQLPALTNMRL